MSSLDQINRTVSVGVLPDMRKKVTRRYDIVDGQATMKDGTKFDANVELPWGTEDAEYTGCRLTHQDVTGQTGNPNKTPNDPPAFLIRVFEEIDAALETLVGQPDIQYDQYNNLIITVHWIQFTTGTPVYQVPGTTTFGGATLLDQTDTDDGTLRTIKRVYSSGGVMSDNERLLFGGRVLLREISSLLTPPATPSGYTLTTESIEFFRGARLYKYGFTKANGGGGSGTGGIISQGFTNSQGGEIEFDPTNPDGATGDVICTTRYVSQPTVTTNPIVQPTGFVLFALDVSYDSGYTLWESKSGFGGGSSVQVDVQGQSDGSLIYTVQQNDATGALIPAYPGTGDAYNTKLTHTRDNGFFRNMAVWHKLPATQTFNKKINFTKPGSAVIGGSPIQFVLNSPVTMDILAEVEVSYDETQISDVPFSVEAYATFYESYTPTDTGITVANSRSLGGYLGGASGTSGTNSVYNGILCDSWEYQLGASTPSSFSADEKVLDVDNDPYLVDVDGVVVFRRTKVSYDFT